MKKIMNNIFTQGNQSWQIIINQHIVKDSYTPDSRAGRAPLAARTPCGSRPTGAVSCGGTALPEPSA